MKFDESPKVRVIKKNWNIVRQDVYELRECQTVCGEKELMGWNVVENEVVTEGFLVQTLDNSDV